MKYIIDGGNKLEGKVTISGSKNASLPIIAGSILSGRKTILYNVPKIEDTKITLQILEILGSKTERKKGKIIIDTSSIKKTDIPFFLMNKLRSSIVLTGALIGRFKKVIFSCPGGCDIGLRPIDLHIKALKKFGVKIEKKEKYLICECEKLEGANIALDFPSVGATENIMLTAVLANGETVISNPAMEPEIVDLQNFLNRMGAKVFGAGTNTIKIEGVKKLKDVSYNIMPDRIETGTFLCMALVTGGHIIIDKTNNKDIMLITTKLEDAGAKIIKENNSRIEIIAPKRIKAVNIKTMPYPGFPTDMQSIFASTMIFAKGTSFIEETIFENRFKILNEFKKMGAKITLKGNIAEIKGSKKLRSAKMYATDLRGGAALITSALGVNGTSIIENAEYILRGYEKLDNKLNSLNAHISKT